MESFLARGASSALTACRRGQTDFRVGSLRRVPESALAETSRSLRIVRRRPPLRKKTSPATVRGSHEWSSDWGPERLTSSEASLT